MNKYKKYLGMVVDGAVIIDVVSYYDFSSDAIEYSFETNKGYGINAEVFISKNLRA